jgi:hypothetical protein
MRYIARPMRFLTRVYTQFNDLHKFKMFSNFPIDSNELYREDNLKNLLKVF